MSHDDINVLMKLNSFLIGASRSKMISVFCYHYIPNSSLNTIFLQERNTLYVFNQIQNIDQMLI